MTIVYNPYFTNNREEEDENILNERIVFETIVDCEQYIINKGYSVRIPHKNNDYYITEKSHELILKNKDLILKEQEENGLSDKGLDPLFAITDSTYHCPCYKILMFDYITKTIYTQDIDKERERQKRKEDLDKNIENIKGFSNDLADQWNKSDIKKSANSFFSGLSKKTKTFIDSIPEDDDNNYITNYDLESFLVANDFIFDKNEKEYIIYVEDKKEVMVVDRLNEYQMQIMPGFNLLDTDKKQNLHSFISKYIATPIIEREVKKEKYEISSEYLKEGVNHKRFITLGQAENYRNLIKQSLRIDELED